MAASLYHTVEYSYSTIRLHIACHLCLYVIMIGPTVFQQEVLVRFWLAFFCVSVACFLHLQHMIRALAAVVDINWSKRSRKSGGLWTMVQDSMQDPARNVFMFYKAFRMPVDKFALLVTLVAPHVQHVECHPAKLVAVALFRFAHNCQTCFISEHFNIASGSVATYTREFMRVLIMHDVLGWMMQVPRGQAVADTMHAFWQWCGLPNVVGAADGKIFKLARAPARKHHPAQYWAVRAHSKACYGVNAFAVVNAAGQFTYQHCKFPGSVHDSSVFVCTALFEDVSAGSLWHATGGGFRPCLLVDSAFPLTPFTIKRYHVNRFRGSSVQRAFDHAVARGRNPVERAFGRLVQRFHICDALPVHRMSDVPRIIRACMLLHNFCEVFDPMPTVVEDVDVEEDVAVHADATVPSSLREQGRQMRDDMAAWFYERHPV